MNAAGWQYHPAVRTNLVLLTAALTLPLVARAPRVDTPPVRVSVAVNRPGATIPSTLLGVFFEDINFAADGGIYPERVKNRSFEFPDPLMGWRRATLTDAAGRFSVETATPASPANPHYLRVTSTAGKFGVSNEGFRGIGIRNGERYAVRLLARRGANGPASVRVEFENTQGRALGGVTLDGLTTTWQKLSGTITAEATELHALARVVTGGPGTVDLDMVSVFPADTWAHRENGLRADLVQLLKDLHPGFLRFPGGCIVEGRFLEGRYQWKKTIGDPSDRKLIVNRWNDEFSGRAAPDYYQTFGLGFYEYFQLSEDIGASPLPILNCGMACQFNSGELAPLDKIDPVHPGRAGPHRVRQRRDDDAVGREAGGAGPSCAVQHDDDRRRQRAVGSAVPRALREVREGARRSAPRDPARRQRGSVHRARELQDAVGRPAEIGAGFVDEHFYRPPQWFYDNVGRYDSYPRTGPKIFVGEYAAHLPQRQGMRPSTLTAALAEAAWLTGLERNADLVGMSSFAPLFAHVDAWQWTPNLIWFDNLTSFGTPSYYVQQVFGQNRGTTILPVTIDGDAKNGIGGVFASASLDQSAREVVVKLVNPGSDARDVALALDGATAVGARAVTLTGTADAENSLESPTAVSPSNAVASVTSGQYTLPPRSVVVLRVRIS